MCVCDSVLACVRVSAVVLSFCLIFLVSVFQCSFRLSLPCFCYPNCVSFLFVCTALCVCVCLCV